MNSIRKNKRGQVIVMFALFVGLLMGFSALAFDLAYAMVVRAELITALDAAALSAIRYVPDGQTAMTLAANRTFTANLPPGKLAIVNPVLSPPVVTTVNGGIDVAITATADAPTYFARWFGKEAITINAEAQTSRRDRNVILVLDYSISVSSVLNDIKNGAKAFVNSFSETADKVGLVVFSTSGRILYTPQSPFKSGMNTQINTLAAENYTNYGSGLYWAYRALLELNDPLKAEKLNEIVFFTDGEANYFPAQFDVQTGTGRCSSSPARGVFGCTSGYCTGSITNTGYFPNRIFNYTAANMPNDPTVVSNCSNQNQSDGKRVVKGFATRWYPDKTSNNIDILPAGVPMAGYKNMNPTLTGSVTDNNWPSNSLRQDLAKNIADNIARGIRQDPAFDIRIHSIGFNGSGGLDLSLLERIANCEGCPNVSTADANDTSQSKGRYVSANNSADLMDAFLDVAGYIARITY